MTERDDLHTLTGAYVLSALDPHQVASFEAYLTESEDARTEVAELTDTAVTLGLATRPISPPPALKSLIMSQLSTTPQLAPLGLRPAGDAVDSSDAAAPNLTSRTSIGSVTTPEASPQRVTADVAPSADATRRIRHLASGSAKSRARWFTRPAGILVAVAAAAGLFFAGTAAGVGLGPQPQDSQAASFTELYAAPDLQQQASSIAGGGQATLLWSDGLERAAMVTSGLPALGADQTYELWFIEGGTATSAGTFNVGDSGTTLRVLDGQMVDNASVGLTVEPAGGSISPTTDPIVVIEGA